MSNWFGGEMNGEESAFAIVVDTSIDTVLSTSVQPATDGFVYWGDGSPIERVSSPSSFSHTYATTGNYLVKFYASEFSFTEIKDQTEIIELVSMGDVVHKDLRVLESSTSLGFVSSTSVGNCPHLKPSSGDFRNLSDTSFANLFFSGTWNGDIRLWDVSKVTNMFQMFKGASSFNQPIGNWDTSNVTNMASMFRDASSFNQPIGNWDVSNVTAFDLMFRFGSSFNQDLSSWDVSNGTIAQMFYSASDFNNGGATGIGNWNTTNATSLFFTFRQSSFNQPIGNWNVSNVTNFGSLFMQTPFNQDIGSWNVSSGQSFASMFYATPFNQDVGSWNVSSSTTMRRMFAECGSFNQDISSWNPGTTDADFSEMLINTALSAENYSKWLIALANWASYNTYTTSEVLGANGLQYNSGITYSGIGLGGTFEDAPTAKNYLTSTLGWTITDGGTA